MKPKTTVQPPPPPHSRQNLDAAPESEDSSAGGVLLLASLLAGIASIILGTMSLVLWFGFSQWIVLSMPLALLAIVLANSVLVVWWFLGSIDIRIHIIGLTLGVVGVLGWFARSGEIQEIIAGVRIALQGDKTQEADMNHTAAAEMVEPEKVDVAEEINVKAEKAPGRTTEDRLSSPSELPPRIQHALENGKTVWILDHFDLTLCGKTPESRCASFVVWDGEKIEGIELRRTVETGEFQKPGTYSNWFNIGMNKSRDGTQSHEITYKSYPGDEVIFTYRFDLSVNSHSAQNESVAHVSWPSDAYRIKWTIKGKTMAQLMENGKPKIVNGRTMPTNRGDHSDSGLGGIVELRK